MKKPLLAVACVLIVMQVYAGGGKDSSGSGSKSSGGSKDKSQKIEKLQNEKKDCVKKLDKIANAKDALGVVTKKGAVEDTVYDVLRITTSKDPVSELKQVDTVVNTAKTVFALSPVAKSTKATVAVANGILTVEEIKVSNQISKIDKELKKNGVILDPKPSSFGGGGASGSW